MTEQTKDQAIRKARAFYTHLERLVKRYQPEVFGPFAASLLYRVLRDQKQWAFYPPHMVVNSIEANCAYFRGHRDQEMTLNRFNEILNHYKDNYDPYLKHVLREPGNVDLFSLAMSREQFDLQRTPSPNDFARTLQLYEVNNPLPQASCTFRDRNGISFHDWIYMCLAIYSHVSNRSSPLIHPDDYIKSSVASIPREAVPLFLKKASARPKQIGAYFRKLRETYPPHLHIFIRSAFFQTPLVVFDNGTYLVVHPYLIFHYAGEGLYIACSSLDRDTFGREFGRSFQQYTGRLLADFFPPGSIHTESELQEMSRGRTCDFLVDHPDCVLLLECKATRYSSELLTENALSKDNSTGKVADAFGQIVHTAARLRRGVFARRVPRGDKPIVGAVVTYGELYFANSSYYFDTFVSERMEVKLLQDWPSPLAHPPQIVSIGSLESMLVMARETGQSPLDIIGAKLALPFAQTGDWPQYIASYAREVTNWSIPTLDSTANAFLEEIGPERPPPAAL